MADSAKVIANCCGPFRFYGEAVVKACLAAKTHHVDVSGETQVILYHLPLFPCSIKQFLEFALRIIGIKID